MIKRYLISLILTVQSIVTAHELDHDPQVLWSHKLYFMALPQELKEHIFSYLDYSNLTKTSLVQKEWLVLSNRQYQNLSQGHYHFAPSNIHASHPWYIIKQSCRNVQFDQLSAPTIDKLLKKLKPLNQFVSLLFDCSFPLQETKEKSKMSEVGLLIDNLNDLPLLQNLSFVNINIGDEELSRIAPFINNLEQLYLIGNKISQIGIKKLCQHIGTNLKVLFLAHNPLGNDGIIELSSRIYSLPQLEHLDVSATHMGAVGLMRLLDCLPQSLRVLSLSNCNISEGGIRPKDITPDLLRQNDSLAKFFILCEKIPTLKNLNELNLSGNNLTLTSLRLLNAAIKDHQPQWQTLDLSFNTDIDSRCIDCLVKMVTSLPKLQTLRLDSCSLSAQDIIKLQNSKSDLKIILDPH